MGGGGVGWGGVLRKKKEGREGGPTLEKTVCIVQVGIRLCKKNFSKFCNRGLY